MSHASLTVTIGMLLAMAGNMAAHEPRNTLVGVARVDITPDYPIRLTGYASRRSESTGVAQRIWAKALAIGSDQAGPALLITVETCGLPESLLESDCPGAVALISLGCGADMNPNPRGKLEHCQQHGRAMADEVKRLLQGELKPVGPALTCRLVHVDLPFADSPTPAQWEQAAQGTDPNAQRARYFLERIRRGEPVPTALSYPIATWTFGQDLAMVFLAGEVVVDYALRLSRELDAGRLWITAYANDAPCYIASQRILREGGYEADSSMIYYGRPARLRPEAEDILVNAVRKLLPAEFQAEKQ